MRIVKYTHSCVRLEKGDHAVVIDPGSFSEEEPLDGADAVFITHEHADHFDPEKLRARDDLPIWTNQAVADQLAAKLGGGIGDRITVAAAGDTFAIGGFDVAAYGELHEVIHPELPQVPNVGFFVDDGFFHPGDAFTVPDRPVETLMVPISAPWLRGRDSVEYIRAVRPTTALSAHDGMLNDIGLGVVDGLLDAFASKAGTEYRRLTPGSAVEL